MVDGTLPDGTTYEVHQRIVYDPFSLPVSKRTVADDPLGWFEKFDPSQPRDPAGTATGGQWTSTGSGGGSGDSASGSASSSPPGPEGGQAAEGASDGEEMKSYRDKDGTLHTSNVEEAVEALERGEKVVLDQPRQVSVLLDRLNELVADAEARGEKAPEYNLCGVTVKGTSIFCTENKGIARVEMPQLKGEPLPGSKADALPRDERGEVSLTDQFRAHLRDMGVKITDAVERADHMKATQNELVGKKVAGISRAYRDGKLADERLFISSDNYIIDGHHRWASVLGVDLADNISGDHTMRVARVDIPVIELLQISKDFAADWGIPQRSGSSDETIKKMLAGLGGASIFDPFFKYDPGQPRDDHGRWTDSGSGAGSDPVTVYNIGLPSESEDWRMGWRAEATVGSAFGFESQVSQFDPTGPPGINYQKVDAGEGKMIDIILHREKDGSPSGVLYHYDADFPPYEEKGNINVLVAKEHQRKGIGSALMEEAISRLDINWQRQSYTEEGAALINSYFDSISDSVQKYDPGQPRDRRGRWTAASGSGAGGELPQTIGPDAIPDLAAHLGPSLDGKTAYKDIMVDMRKHRRTARAYQQMPDNDPAAHAAYKQMAKEVSEQHDLLTKTLGYKVEVVDTDPYRSVRELVADMRNNKRIKIMATATTGSHPFLSDAQNDQFRAVHDAFGHAATGRGFDRHGEEAAYQAHASMFSKEARRALASETRGQNSVLITTGEFPEQKVALLPEEFVKELLKSLGIVDTGSADDDNLYDDGGTHHTSLGRHPRRKPVAKSRRDRIGDLLLKFNANQPRHPKGHPLGGQWVDDGDSGSSVIGERVSPHYMTPYVTKTGRGGAPVNFDATRVESMPEGFLNRVLAKFKEHGMTDIIGKEGLLTKNLMTLMERIQTEAQDLVAIGKEWYAEAQDRIIEHADASGIPHDRAIAMTALMSPNAEWGQNIAMAGELFRQLKADEPIWATENDIEWLKEKTQSEEGWKYAEVLKIIESGKEVSLSQIEDEVVAAAAFQLTGRRRGLVSENPTLSGTYGLVSFATGTVNIGKAIMVYRDGATAASLDEIFGGHKVRSFYNNISDPYDERGVGDVTIDTHAASAAQLFRMPMESDRATDTVWGLASTRSNQFGSYPVYADAIRSVAEAYNMSANQAQAVLWVGWQKFRHDYPGIVVNEDANTIAAGLTARDVYGPARASTIGRYGIQTGESGIDNPPRYTGQVSAHARYQAGTITRAEYQEILDRNPNDEVAR